MVPFGSFPFDASGVDSYAHPQFINAMRAPTSQDIYPAGTEWQDSSVSPAIIYQTIGGGSWDTGGSPEATTTTYGTVLLTDNSEPVATKAYADALAIAGAPVATTSTSGIGKLVSDANAVARIASTGVQAYFVQPSNLTAVMSEPGPIGDITPDTGAFTGLSTDGSAAVSLAATGASDFTVATGDLSLIATASSVVINGGEAVDDAIQLTSASGGLSASLAKSVVIASTEANADSVQLTSAGGMDLTATGAAGKDIDIVCTSGSVNITGGENIASSVVVTNKGFQCLTTGAAGQDITLSNTGGSITLVATENAAQNIYLHANGGASETVQLHADQGTGDTSVYCLSDVGGVTLSGGKAAATAVNLTAADVAGGITMTAGTGGVLPTTTGPIALVSTYDNSANMYLHANGGTSETIKIHSDQGTSVTSLNLLSDVGGITLNAGLAAANSIVLEANSAGGGGIDVNVGSGGMTIDTTGALSLDAAGASNFSTSSGDLSLIASTNSVVITGAEAAVDAVQINASNVAGGVDINLGTGGITIDTTGAMSFDGAATSNFTVTGAAADATVQSVGGSVNILASEAAANAVRIFASDAAGGIDVDCGSGGFLVDAAAGAISLDSALASNFTVTGAADLTLSSSAGAVNVTSGEANADSINVTSGGGMNIVATGAAAKDIIMTCTSGSMTLTAGESASDAFNLTASGAASGMTLTAGTSGISFASGQKVKVTSVAAAVSPYALLGTDYFVACDVTGGILTITLPAAPSTGRYVIVSDSVGQSGANTITIDGNGKNISLAGTAAGTKTIATAYKAVGLVYNGTLWNGFALA